MHSHDVYCPYLNKHNLLVVELFVLSSKVDTPWTRSVLLSKTKNKKGPRYTKQRLTSDITNKDNPRLVLKSKKRVVVLL